MEHALSTVSNTWRQYHWWWNSFALYIAFLGMVWFPSINVMFLSRDSAFCPESIPELIAALVYDKRRFARGFYETCRSLWCKLWGCRSPRPWPATLGLQPHLESARQNPGWWQWRWRNNMATNSERKRQQLRQSCALFWYWIFSALLGLRHFLSQAAVYG